MFANCHLECDEPKLQGGGGKGKATAKIINKQANKSKRQRFRQEGDVRKRTIKTGQVAAGDDIKTSIMAAV